MANYSHRNPAEVERRVIRRTEAMRLKEAGATYEEIAQTCGYGSRGAAYKDLQARLSEVENEEAEVASRLRVLQSARLDRLLQSVWDDATDKNARNHYRGVEVALKIMERQARLQGTDAPIKTEVTVIENIDERIEQLLKLYQSEPEVIQGEIVGD